MNKIPLVGLLIALIIVFFGTAAGVIYNVNHRSASNGIPVEIFLNQALNNNQLVRTGELWGGTCEGQPFMLFFNSQGYGNGNNYVQILTGNPEVALYSQTIPAPGNFAVCGNTFNILWDDQNNDWVIQPVK